MLMPGGWSPATSPAVWWRPASHHECWRAQPADPCHERRWSLHRRGHCARRSLGNVQVRRMGLVPYVEAWQLQSALADQLVDGTAEDTLLLLEHPSVYTAGRRTED